jgi:hypothetical protein
MADQLAYAGTFAARPPRTTDVSLLHLYALRTVYLMVAVLMGGQIWPVIFHHTLSWDVMHGVGVSMLGAVTALCLLGLRYPLQMLPLLFVEMVWKATWLLAVAWPLSTAGKIDAATAETITACMMGIIFPIVIPWGYVWRNYVTKPGDRWK